MTQIFRHSFVKDGLPSHWYQLDSKDAEEAARIEFKANHTEWKKLKSEGRIQMSAQFSEDGKNWKPFLTLRPVR